MLSVVDSAQETNKLMWVYDTMKNKSEKYEILQPLGPAEIAEEIGIPQVLLRIKPSEMTHSKVGVGL